jgi:hypothetical protein
MSAEGEHNDRLPQLGEMIPSKRHQYEVISMDCKILRGTFLIKPPHFCTVLNRGKVPERFKFLIMKLYVIESSRAMSVEDLHRDIKPRNFAIGRQAANKQQLIYFYTLDFTENLLGFLVIKNKKI